MKAFLSHSSRDKGFVETVAEFMRPGTYELDSLTFDDGLVNSDAIIESLKRVELFCLFLSESSIKSPYVEFERLLAGEFFARGGIQRFLAICLDKEAFSAASSNVKFFNVVRRGLHPEAVARLIQGNLIAVSKRDSVYHHPFVGRANALAELERQTTDFRSVPTKALYVSGNVGSGRRSIVHKFYEDQYPQVGQIFPVINIEIFSGLEELHRAVIMQVRQSITAKELQTHAHAFSIADRQEKVAQIARLLNSLLAAREAAFLMDMGGVLTDAGALESDVSDIVSQLDTQPYPPVAFITRRMIPHSLRREQGDLAYLAVRSLTRDEVTNLIGRLSKDKGIAVSVEQMDDLISISDGHPFNVYRMIDEIERKGIALFLANPTDFIDWKHRQSSEYLGRVELSEDATKILALLRLTPELDFDAICASLALDPQTTSDALLYLVDLHIVEPVAERFRISPALRIAVERDRRIGLAKDVRMKAVRFLAETLSVRLEEGTAQIALVDAAVLSSIEAGGELSAVVAALLLPSHYVRLASRHYDERDYRECIRLAKEALKRADRLSRDAIVAACRFMCLAAARTGDEETFDEGIRRLTMSADDAWTRSNIRYLTGFNARMKGRLPAAEADFREAYKLSPGNQAAAREIAAICLLRSNLEEAEVFAREAHARASRNPYLVDILLAVLIRRYGNSASHTAEIEDLFDILKAVGEEDGRSFYTTRRAEYEHRWGDNRKALRLIEEAVSKTPTIFEPRRLYAEILLKDGNKTRASEVISELEVLVNARDPRERRTNFRAYLETRANYLVEIGQYKEAKKIFDDGSLFSSDEKAAAIRDIDMTQAYRQQGRK